MSASRPPGDYRDGGMDDALRGWIESLQETYTAPAPAPDSAVEAAHEPPPTRNPTPGIVPPNGPLPRRFGPSLGLFWASRLGAVAIGIALTVYNLRDLLGDGRTLAGLLIAGGVAVVFLVGWVRDRGNLEAMSVTFEPAGIIVRTQLGGRYLPWGNLVGLRPPDGVRSGWAIEANVDGRPLLVTLPRTRAWTRELVDALQGRSDHLDPRFERPADRGRSGPSFEGPGDRARRG